MRYIFPILTLCTSCQSKLKSGSYITTNKEDFYGSGTLSIGSNSVSISQKLPPTECPSLYQSFLPSDRIYINAASPLLREEDSKNDPIFFLKSSECSFPEYSAQWFNGESVDTDSIECEKTITKPIPIHLENGAKEIIELNFIYTSRLSWQKEKKAAWVILDISLDPPYSDTKTKLISEQAFNPDCRRISTFYLKPVK